MRGSLSRCDMPMDRILVADIAAEDPGERFGGRHQGDGLGRRAAQPRGRHLLPVARAHLPPRLWPDRGRPGHLVQPPERRAQDGHGRPAAQRYRSADRRRRRDPGARRTRHARLLAQPGGDGARARRTAGCTPAISAISTTRAGSRSPTARRTSSSTTRATMSRRRRSRDADAAARDRPGDDLRRPPAVHGRGAGARPRDRRCAGPRTRAFNAPSIA